MAARPKARRGGYPEPPRPQSRRFGKALPNLQSLRSQDNALLWACHWTPRSWGSAPAGRGLHSAPATWCPDRCTGGCETAQRSRHLVPRLRPGSGRRLRAGVRCVCGVLHATSLPADRARPADQRPAQPRGPTNATGRGGPRAGASHRKPRRPRATPAHRLGHFRAPLPGVGAARCPGDGPWPGPALPAGRSPGAFSAAAPASRTRRKAGGVGDWSCGRPCRPKLREQGGRILARARSGGVTPHAPPARAGPKGGRARARPPEAFGPAWEP